MAALKRRVPLHTQMLLGGAFGAGAGVAAYLFAGQSSGLETFVKYVAQPVGQIFLRLLFMLVLPLIFSALALGVARLGDLRQLGRIGLKTLAYTVVVSAIAVLIGLALVNVLRPGEGMSPEARARLMEGAAGRAAAVGGAMAPRSGLDSWSRSCPRTRSQRRWRATSWR